MATCIHHTAWAEVPNACCNILSPFAQQRISKNPQSAWKLLVYIWLGDNGARTSVFPCLQNRLRKDKVSRWSILHAWSWWDNSKSYSEDPFSRGKRWQTAAMDFLWLLWLWYSTSNRDGEQHRHGSCLDQGRTTTTTTLTENSLSIAKSCSVKYSYIF